MSRSYKKNKIHKLKGWLGKKKANRIIRRINKQRIKENKEPILSKEKINPYEVIDYMYIYDKNDNLAEEYIRKLFNK